MEDIGSKELLLVISTVQLEHYIRRGFGLPLLLCAIDTLVCVQVL